MFDQPQLLESFMTSHGSGPKAKEISQLKAIFGRPCPRSRPASRTSRLDYQNPPNIQGTEDCNQREWLLGRFCRCSSQRSRSLVHLWPSSDDSHHSSQRI